MIQGPIRGDVYLIELDPTRGSEIRKTRPCLVASPDELNRHLRTVIVAPMTTGGQLYPWRVPCRFRNTRGSVALDQLRTVDRERLVKRLGALSANTLSEVLSKLSELFAP
ncbi:MAG: type II toxin-antitoxin system PemK/MazF family toxin [Gemmatimonadaceae bacterium]